MLGNACAMMTGSASNAKDVFGSCESLSHQSSHWLLGFLIVLYRNIVLIIKRASRSNVRPGCPKMLYIYTRKTHFWREAHIMRWTFRLIAEPSKGRGLGKGRQSDPSWQEAGGWREAHLMRWTFLYCAIAYVKGRGLGKGRQSCFPWPKAGGWREAHPCDGRFRIVRKPC